MMNTKNIKAIAAGIGMILADCKVVEQDTATSLTVTKVTPRVFAGIC